MKDGKFDMTPGVKGECAKDAVVFTFGNSITLPGMENFIEDKGKEDNYETR